MGFLSKALGMGSTFEHKGQTYRMSGLSLGIQAQFELYYEGVVIAKAKSLRSHFTPAELADADPVAAVVRDISAGMYTFGSRACSEALKLPQHITYLMYLMIHENHPEVTFARVQEMFSDNFDAAITAFQASESSDPKASRPDTMDPSGQNPDTSMSAAS